MPMVSSTACLPLFVTCALDCGTRELLGAVRVEVICGGGMDELVYSFNDAVERTTLQRTRSANYATAVLLSRNGSLPQQYRIFSTFGTGRTTPFTEKPCSNTSLTIQLAMIPSAPVTGTFLGVVAGTAREYLRSTMCRSPSYVC